MNEGRNRREFVREAVGFTAGLSVLGLSACGGNAAKTTTTGTGAAAPKVPASPVGTLRMAIVAEPSGFDPTQSGDQPSFPVLQNVYDGLVRWDAKYEKLEGALAESWTSSDDGREWEFKLRSGATFHDGEPVDSTAIRKSLEYYQEQAGKGFFLATFFPPKTRKIDDSDPSTLRIVLSEPFGDFDRNLTTIRAISPKSIRKGSKSIAATPVGTGAYKFVRRERGLVTLEAFDGHWGDGPYLEQVQLRVIADAASQLTAIKAGDIDLMMRLPPNRVDGFKARGVKTVGSPNWAVNYLWFRADVKPWDNPKVRQAMSLAIDRDALVKALTNDQYKAAHSVLPEGIYGHVDLPNLYPHDPERAKALIKEAGLEGFKTTIGTPSGQPLGREFTEAIAAQLNAVGLNAKGQVFEEGVYTKLSGADKPSVSAWYVNISAITGGPIGLTAGLFTAIGHYENAEITGLQGKVAAQADGPERLQNLRRLQELYASTPAPWLPLNYQSQTDVVRDNVFGYAPPRDSLMARLGTTYLG